MSSEDSSENLNPEDGDTNVEPISSGQSDKGFIRRQVEWLGGIGTKKESSTGGSEKSDSPESGTVDQSEESKSKKETKGKSAINPEESENLRKFLDSQYGESGESGSQEQQPQKGGEKPVRKQESSRGREFAKTEILKIDEKVKEVDEEIREAQKDGKKTEEEIFSRTKQGFLKRETRMAERITGESFAQNTKESLENKTGKKYKVVRLEKGKTVEEYRRESDMNRSKSEIKKNNYERAKESILNRLPEGVKKEFEDPQTGDKKFKDFLKEQKGRGEFDDDTYFRLVAEGIMVDKVKKESTTDKVVRVAKNVAASVGTGGAVGLAGGLLLSNPLGLGLLGASIGLSAWGAWSAIKFPTNLVGTKMELPLTDGGIVSFNSEEEFKDWAKKQEEKTKEVINEKAVKRVAAKTKNEKGQDKTEDELEKEIKETSHYSAESELFKRYSLEKGFDDSKTGKALEREKKKFEDWKTSEQKEFYGLLGKNEDMKNEEHFRAMVNAGYSMKKDGTDLVISLNGSDFKKIGPHDFAKLVEGVKQRADNNAKHEVSQRKELGGRWRIVDETKEECRKDLIDRALKQAKDEKASTAQPAKPGKESGVHFEAWQGEVEENAGEPLTVEEIKEALLAGTISITFKGEKGWKITGFTFGEETLKGEDLITIKNGDGKVMHVEASALKDIRKSVDGPAKNPKEQSPSQPDNQKKPEEEKKESKSLKEKITEVETFSQLYLVLRQEGEISIGNKGKKSAQELIDSIEELIKETKIKGKVPAKSKMGITNTGGIKDRVHSLLGDYLAGKDVEGKQDEEKAEPEDAKKNLFEILGINEGVSAKEIVEHLQDLYDKETNDAAAKNKTEFENFFNKHSTFKFDASMLDHQFGQRRLEVAIQKILDQNEKAVESKPENTAVLTIENIKEAIKAGKPIEVKAKVKVDGSKEKEIQEGWKIIDVINNNKVKLFKDGRIEEYKLDELRKINGGVAEPLAEPEEKPIKPTGAKAKPEKPVELKDQQQKPEAERPVEPRGDIKPRNLSAKVELPLPTSKVPTQENIESGQVLEGHQLWRYLEKYEPGKALGTLATDMGYRGNDWIAFTREDDGSVRATQIYSAVKYKEAFIKKIIGFAETSEYFTAGKPTVDELRKKLENKKSEDQKDQLDEEFDKLKPDEAQNKDSVPESAKEIQISGNIKKALESGKIITVKIYKSAKSKGPIEEGWQVKDVINHGVVLEKNGQGNRFQSFDELEVLNKDLIDQLVGQEEKPVEEKPVTEIEEKIENEEPGEIAKSLGEILELSPEEVDVKNIVGFLQTLYDEGARNGNDPVGKEDIERAQKEFEELFNKNSEKPFSTSMLEKDKDRKYVKKIVGRILRKEKKKEQ